MGKTSVRGTFIDWRSKRRVEAIDALCLRQGFRYRNRVNYLTACICIALYQG